MKCHSTEEGEAEKKKFFRLSPIERESFSFPMCMENFVISYAQTMIVATSTQSLICQLPSASENRQHWDRNNPNQNDSVKKVTTWKNKINKLKWRDEREKKNAWHDEQNETKKWFTFWVIILRWLKMSWIDFYILRKIEWKYFIYFFSHNFIFMKFLL